MDRPSESLIARCVPSGQLLSLPSVPGIDGPPPGAELLCGELEGAPLLDEVEPLGNEELGGSPAGIPEELCCVRCCCVGVWGNGVIGAQADRTTAALEAKTMYLMRCMLAHSGCSIVELATASSSPSG